MPGTTRLSEMSIDLGDEHIVLERIEAMEALSTPFTVLVDILSPLEIDLQPHLGKPCSLKVFEDDELLRHFHGLVVAGEYHDENSTGHRYRLTLKPWTFFMSQNRNMAIFQDQSATDIIKQVLKTNGISDAEFRLSEQRQTRLYCVQYRESDFAFISRLMEEEGIYYYFTHEKDRHVMILNDAPSAHVNGSPSHLVYNPQAAAVFAANSKARASGGKHYLQSWAERISTRAGSKVTIRDFDFKSPERALSAEISGERQHASDDREFYDYPGRYALESADRGAQENAGRQRGKILLQGSRALRRVFAGTSQATGLCCGDKITIEQHPVDRMNNPYIITSTVHSIVAETYRSGADRETQINLRFEAIPADTPFQAPQATPRPVVEGLESAVVTGPDGEEIYTDEFGRVKVRFHWDRAATPGEQSTCWIRVSQTGGLGNLILPRVGHEVLVDFLGGDPDRPLVVGRVFNKANMPTYDLPANKTRALWRTKRYGQTGSYPESKALDTGAPGVNELRFEDKGGSEEVFLHAERDMNTRIRFDETHHVGHDQSLMIGHDRTEIVGKDEKITIMNDRDAEVQGDEKLKIDKSQKLEVGTSRDTKIGTSDTIKAGTSYELTASTSIEIKVGSSKIKMDPTGITIESPTITIDGKMMLGMKSTMTKIDGSAMVMIKGAITMIN